MSARVGLLLLERSSRLSAATGPFVPRRSPQLPLRSLSVAGAHVPTARPDFDALSWHGWSWRRDATVDTNYVDLALLFARNSTCKGGHMGCVLVRGINCGQGQDHVDAQVGEVLLCTINTPLFSPRKSDIHAEANAIATCAAHGVPTRACSAYISFAPCIACFKLLVGAGVGRIVSTRRLLDGDCVRTADALGASRRVKPAHVQHSATPTHTPARSPPQAQQSVRVEAHGHIK